MKLKKLIIAVALVGTSLNFLAQIALPPNAFGINHWMPDYYITYSTTPLNGAATYANIQTMVENTSAVVVRIGGNGYDGKGVSIGNSATNNDYIRAIAAVKLRNPNAKFIIQIPYKSNSFGFTTAQTGSLVANIIAAYPNDLFYYSIGNEYDLYSSPYNSLSQIATDFKAYAQKIKETDLNAKVMGPNFTNFYASIGGSNYIQNLYSSGSYDITGYISGGVANGLPYCDIIDYHTYPGGSNGSMENGTSAITSTQYNTWRPEMENYPQNKFKDELSNTTVNNLKGIQKLINEASRGTGSSYPLKCAITEVNVTAKNMTLTSQGSTSIYENTFEGIACRSFFAGQFWMEMYCSFLTNLSDKAELMSPWSIHEAGGAGTIGDLGMTKGTANASTDPTPLPTYYHYEMLADNFRNCTYVKKPTSNNTALKVFGAYNTLNGAANTKYVVVLINQTSNNISTIVQLDDTYLSGNQVIMHFPYTPTSYTNVTVDANSTTVLVFNHCTGEYLRKIEYKLSGGASGKPVYTHFTPVSCGGANYIVMAELGNDASSCCGGVTLTSSPAIPGATYTWYSSASNFVTSLQSGSSNTYNPPSGSATYKVVVSYNSQTASDYVKASVSNGCCKFASIVEKDANAIDNTLSNVPNPTNDNTTIIYTLPTNVKKAEIQITDISGKLVKSLAVSSENKSINFDCTPYANGIYFYSLNVDGNIISTKKLIIAK